MNRPGTNQSGTNHLTDEQLAAWLLGEAPRDTYVHLESCTQCHAEALQLQDGISRYAIATRQQSARAQSVRLAGNFAPRKALILHRLRWAGAGVLAMLLAAQTAWMMKPAPVAISAPVASTPVVSQPAAQMSDDELLEAVNNDLSREVPLALAPVSAITTARNKIAAASVVAATNDSEK